MDYSQFLHMREELSLVVVLLLLFLADLFMSPDAHKNDGKARLNTMLPVILMAVHTAINLIPAYGISCETTGNTLSPIMWLIQKGAIPNPATQAMRQITATRSSHVASVSVR